MKNILTIVLICCLHTWCLNAQIFNNSYNVDDQTYSSQASMVIDEDGSTVTVHTIREYTNSSVYDARIVKVDDQGNVIWSKEYGVPDVDERANGICKTDDDGYLIVGVRDDSEYGFGSWVFRIDNNGNLIWSRWYSDPNLFISEGYLATRTFESDENYMIVGTANYPRRIYAMKIDGNGNMYWSHTYYDPALVNSKYDYVTSIVEDRDREGYIVAGTEHDYYTTGFSTLDLFTIGIGVNGNITRPYKKYDLDLGDNESNPHIIHDLDNDGFVMAFGTRAGGVQNGTVSFISTMFLNKYLNPTVAYLYASPNAYESHANSIYADPHGSYALGCFIYDGIEGQPNGVRNPSFLSLEPNGAPINYFRYNVPQDQTCTFMAQDFTATHENYVLKTDHRENGVWSIGLIRTELNGESECMQDEPINWYDSDVYRWKQKYKVYDFAETLEAHIDYWDQHPEPIHCEDLVFTGDDATEISKIVPISNADFHNTSPESISATDEQSIIVYPTLLNDYTEKVTLEYTATATLEVEILIYNAQGQLIHSTSESAVEGMNVYTVDQSRFATGMNLIVLSDNNKNLATVRAIKL